MSLIKYFFWNLKKNQICEKNKQSSYNWSVLEIWLWIWDNIVHCVCRKIDNFHTDFGTLPSLPSVVCLFHWWVSCITHKSPHCFVNFSAGQCVCFGYRSNMEERCQGHTTCLNPWISNMRASSPSAEAPPTTWNMKFWSRDLYWGEGRTAYLDKQEIGNSLYKSLAINFNDTVRDSVR